MTTSKAQKEKAEAQVAKMVDESYDPSGQRYFVEWIVKSLKPEIVNQLASEFDEDTKIANT